MAVWRSGRIGIAQLALPSRAPTHTIEYCSTLHEVAEANGTTWRVSRLSTCPISISQNVLVELKSTWIGKSDAASMPAAVRARRRVWVASAREGLGVSARRRVYRVCRARRALRAGRAADAHR